MNRSALFFSLGLLSAICIAGCSSSGKQTVRDGYVIVTQKDGPALGYSPESGVSILQVDGKAFKDLNRNGKLDPYEDWRLSPLERARNLSRQLSVEEIAGLMLYSGHQAVPAGGRAGYTLPDELKAMVRKPEVMEAVRSIFQTYQAGGDIADVDLSALEEQEQAVLRDRDRLSEILRYLMAGASGGTYDGLSLGESGANSWDLTDQQKQFLREDHLRAVLITTVESPEVAARWNNTMQAFVEGLDHGIPSNTSSDPRHQASSNMEFNAGGGGAISVWPSSLGMAATFSPELVERFGEIASREYRALGIATALSPQVDVATEPRWWRFSGTFGEDAFLSRDMARAYCDGFQTSPESERIDGAWGYGSVNAMVKHWYGYGAQEAGRDSHFAHGKFAVYPGNNLADQKIPFTEGAFKLEGGTGMASAVMPVYSILWNQDPSGENVGGAYSKWLIDKQLRQDAGFEGVVCTDWSITADNTALDFTGGGKPWGVENLSVAERHFRILEAGVDQFGGNNEAGPVIEAYNLWARKYGEASARERFELSATRLLLNMFRTGLFENPYVDPAETSRIVGNPDFMEEGYQAQLQSVVMLKNKGNSVLPVTGKKKVWIPKRHYPATPGIWGGMSEDYTDYPIDLEMAGKYYDIAATPEEADFAVVKIFEPSISMGWDQADVNAGGNGYIPVSLQYEDYTAVEARARSIAGGDPLEKFTNRSYRGKTVHTRNYDDLLLVRETRRRMGDKPVVVIVELGKPVVLREIEPLADAILLSFEVQNQAILDIISGKAEPSALLPMQLPKDMRTVELQKEDIARDMECYKDTEGNSYDFAFGLDWKGVIDDERVKKYK